MMISLEVSLRIHVTALVVMAMGLVAPEGADAQDRGRMGLTMGYPASVGVIWPVGDRLALRPELSLSRAAGDVTTTTTQTIGVGLPAPVVSSSSSSSSTKTWQVGVGISGLFYVGRSDALRTYLSPRFAYSRTATSSSSSNGATDATNSTYAAGGSFGVEYSLAPRIGLFGEIGLSYTDTTNTTSSGVPSALSGGLAFRTVGTTSGVSTRSGVGVIFFF